jgi:hypothetical protein
MTFRTATFGVPGEFELVIDSTHASEQCFRLVRAAFRIRGLRLGTEEFFDVRDVFDRLVDTVNFNGQRESCRIFGLPAATVFEGITRVLLGEDADREDFAGVERLERFKLWFHSTLGDCWLLLVTCRGTARILFTAAGESVPQEVQIATSAVELALVEASDHLRLMQSFH